MRWTVGFGALDFALAHEVAIRVDGAVLQLQRHLAIGDTVILLHSSLPLVGVSMLMEIRCQHNGGLADGYRHRNVGVLQARCNLGHFPPCLMSHR